MDLNERNKIITRTTVDLLQNFLPTKIWSSIDNSDEESNQDTDDIDEARLFYEMLKSKTASAAEKNAPGPSGGAPRPTKRAAVPTKIATVPTKKAAVPIKTSAVPVKKATVPPKAAPVVPSKLPRLDVIIREKEVEDPHEDDELIDTDNDDDDDLISIGSSASMTFFDIFQQEMISDLHLKIEDVQVMLLSQFYRQFEHFIYIPSLISHNFTQNSFSFSAIS